MTSPVPPQPFFIHALDHVQIAMPAGQEEIARQFYSGVLGLTEIPVPDNLKHRGALWFEQGSLKLHLGIEPDFHPARKAHPAFLVHHLDSLAKQLEAAGVPITPAEPIQGFHRFHIFDPFGNRIELLEPTQ